MWAASRDQSSWDPRPRGLGTAQQGWRLSLRGDFSPRRNNGTPLSVPKSRPTLRVLLPASSAFGTLEFIKLWPHVFPQPQLSPHVWEGGCAAPLVPVLQEKTLRLREGQLWASGHTISEPCVQVPESLFCVFSFYFFLFYFF